MKVYKNLYTQITSTENLFLAWDEFRRGKSGKADVMRFEWQLEENIFGLQRHLASNEYNHGAYHAFYITDPKQRLIHKALVRDRIVHHAIFKVLNPIFEPTFIASSFSCRKGKGTHRGVRTLTRMLRQVSKNNTGPCWALKCDIHKFFASMDHEILMSILKRRINDKDTIKLLGDIISSFNTLNKPNSGLPIGNLTSQLFANVYMNELDQFVKHWLKIKHYVRYTDDFVIVDRDRERLLDLIQPIEEFLLKKLKLSLHPRKIKLRNWNQGIDFLGYISKPNCILLRTKTRNRILKKVNAANLSSYLGVCSHADTYELQQLIKKTSSRASGCSTRKRRSTD